MSENSEFPYDAAPAEQLRFLLRYAVLAPSTHNTQPWIWELEGDAVSLYSDTNRQLPALDPQGRELVMSCGAALEHLRVAIHAFGFKEEIEILPDVQHHPDLLARVRLAGRQETPPHERVLFEAIPERHTNRNEFEERSLPDSLLDALEVEAHSIDETAGENVWLLFVEDMKQREAILDLIARGDIVQGSDKAVRDDIAQWITPNTSTRHEGIPGYALGMSDMASRVAPLLMRVMNVGDQQAQKDVALAAHAPVLAIIGTKEDTPYAWIAAGQSLARVLLRAHAAGVDASFFNQPVQVNALWSQLRHILHRNDFPQLIFRLGYSNASTQPTPRRAVEEVTTTNIALRRITDAP